MTEDPDAVLAFLLGATPSLSAASESGSNPTTSSSSTTVNLEESEEEEDDDTPMLEPLSDNDSDWDAATSCKSESDSTNEQQAATQDPLEKADPVKEVSKEDPQEIKDNNAEEEHEDDGTSSTGTESDVELHQEEERKAEGTIKATSKATGSGKGKDLSARFKWREREGNAPTMEELWFVGCIATVLAAYLVACVYSFFHPLVSALPDPKELFSAYDMSNVSVRIVNPVDNALITPQGVAFEWTLANFPTEALRLYGAEVYRYQVSVDDEVFKSEVGFLALGNEGGVNEFEAETVNRTVRVPIPQRRFEGYGKELVKLHLDVTIPIPGLIGETTTFKQDVYVRKPPAPSPKDGLQLVVTAPVSGATFEHGQSIVLEYTAVNVREMEVLIDDLVYVKKTHIGDGNMLVRGLGVGQHKLEVRALESGQVASSSVLHVDMVARKATAE